jgi:hypothetical protein
MPIFECSRCNEMTYSATAGARTACGRCGSKFQRVLEGSFDVARQSARELGEADHAALVCDGVESAAPLCARFVSDGVDAGERVVAGVPAELREAICALVGSEVELAVEWADPRSTYADFDAERVAATYEALIAAESRTTRILACLDAESAEGLDPAEFERYERRAHDIVTQHGAVALCVYDRRALPPDFLEVGARRHGLVLEGEALRRNERFAYEPA